ncbi:MAG: endonuclease/exonuclease/phosphatase family protein [Elusimicrobiota bacterium]|jgi:endonuclease/exonuclease/phosphatase family metal-dependent hydrolase
MEIMSRPDIRRRYSAAFLCLTALLSLGCSSSPLRRPAAEKDRRFKIVTLNIRTAYADDTDRPKGNGWDARKERLMSLLEQTRAQIIGLQELNPQASELGSRFSKTHELRASPPDLGILIEKTAFSIQDAGSRKLEGSDQWGDRFFQWVRLAPRKGCGCLLAINTHFSTDKDSRLANSRTLSEWLKEQDPSCGLMIFGDLNEAEGPVTAPLLVETGPGQAWEAAAPGQGTFNEFAGPPGGRLDASLKLDHILIRSPQLRMLESKVHDAHPGQPAYSDHYALEASVEMGPSLCESPRPAADRQ